MMAGMSKGNLASHFHPRWMMVALLSLVAVLGLTHIPQEVLSRVVRFDPFDKVEHVVAYGVVAAFLFLSLRRPIPVWLLAALCAALAVIGALDETTQPLVNRQASIFDYAADLVGVALASSVLLVRWLWDQLRGASASVP
jgi:VanZ family protein